MSADFKTRFIQDATIADVTPEISYAVKGGAASTTYQPFPATTSSNSSLTFSIQLPSENIVVGRDALIENQISFSVLIGTASAPLNNPTIVTDEDVLKWGSAMSFGSFPVSSNMTTANAQINNTSTSVNLKDVLPQLLRLNDSRFLYKYNGYAPSLPDQAYYKYSDAVNTNNNPMADYSTASYDVDLLPRGAYPVEILAEHYGDDGTGMAYINDEVLASDPATYTGGQYWIVNIRATITEPIFVSPFTWSAPEHNAQGLLGINNMAFNFTIDSQIPRLVSSANSIVTSVVAGDSRTTATSTSSNLFSNSRVLLKFLSTQDTDRLQTKNVVPFMDFPRYVTSQFNNGTALTAGSSVTASSNNIQLNQLPDYFIVCVRKQMNLQTITDADAFLQINSATFNLNNMSGLLSTAQPQDLWRLSTKSCSNQNWSEFSGSAWKRDGNTQSLKPTTGSLLVIDPADLSLPSYLAPGSLGNFQLQLTLNVTNQSEEEVQAEMVVIAVNSGFMVTQMGQSAVYTGVLTREAVLDAKLQKPASSEEYRRLVGGKLMDRVCSAVPHLRSAVGAMKHGGMKHGGAEVSGAGRLSGMY